MLQRVLFDRRIARLYVVAALAACTPRTPTALIPPEVGPATAGQVAEWVRSTQPTGYLMQRFKWQLRDERGAAGGRGTLRFAAPDSVRLDVAGPFGAGRAAAVVVGDSARWTEPQDAIARLVPSYPLMWAMFGTAREPAPSDQLRGIQTPTSAAWQYVSGGDTTSYARIAGAPGHLLTEVRHGRTLVGRVDATLGPDGRPVSARLTVPSVPAQLDLTFSASTTPPVFAHDLWLPGQH